MGWSRASAHGGIPSGGSARYGSGEARALFLEQDDEIFPVLQTRRLFPTHHVADEGAGESYLLGDLPMRPVVGKFGRMSS